MSSEGMGRTVLITGGLGFIGQATASKLLEGGFKVRILDNLLPQIHGTTPHIADDISQGAEIIIGDILDQPRLRAAFSNVDAVIHLAAETGTGQSMYQVSHHINVNTRGSANLIEEILQRADIRNVVVASSRAVYGEGAYKCAQHGPFSGVRRRHEDLQDGRFDVRCPICGQFSLAVATPETAILDPQSIYGLTKFDLERMSMLLIRGDTLSFNILRFQNVYGPGQSLNNPYTGILAIFAALARKNEEILIFEDGLESRDFIFIDDVADAIVKALSSRLTGVHTYNIGTGVGTSVKEVAEAIRTFFKSSSTLRMPGVFRLGDIRHNMAEMAAANRELAFSARTAFADGLPKFLEWAAPRIPEQTLYRKSIQELEAGNLLIRR